MIGPIQRVGPHPARALGTAGAGLLQAPGDGGIERAEPGLEDPQDGGIGSLVCLRDELRGIFILPGEFPRGSHCEHLNGAAGRSGDQNFQDVFEHFSIIANRQRGAGPTLVLSPSLADRSALAKP